MKPSKRRSSWDANAEAIAAILSGATVIGAIYLLARQFPREIELAIWIYLMVGQLVCGWKRIGPSTCRAAEHQRIMTAQNRTL